MMTTATSSNTATEQGIVLDRDVEEFVETISGAYGRRDFNGIMTRVSDGFLHQGMDKTTFGARLEQSYLLEHVDWMKISVLRFDREENTGELVGFAETNLGVMPAAENLLPFIEGSKLVLERDGWKLLGNQSKSTVGLYRAFHQLSAYFAPEDVSLYRSILPDTFEVPAKPLVFVKVAAYEQMRLPLPLYNMAHVQILAEYEGEPGWHTLTMPETEWLPVEMGKTLGYPKYVADSITLERSRGGWQAGAASRGENALSISMHFEEDHSQASWFERVTSDHPLAVLRKLLPPFKEKPWFLMMPIGGKDAGGRVRLLRGDPLISGIPRVQETFGTIRVSLETNQPWAGLFPRELTTKGVVMEFSGQLMLRHVPIAVVRGRSDLA
jgi:hypothetical protein